MVDSCNQTKIVPVESTHLVLCNSDGFKGPESCNGSSEAEEDSTQQLSDEEIEGASSDDNRDEESVKEEGIIDEMFFDLQVWDEIGKNLEDFTEYDVQRLSFKNLDSCIEFYRIYSTVKGFGIRHKTTRKSIIDGHPTSQKIWCAKEGYRTAKYLEYPDRKRRAKAITRCGCKAMINFKWDPKSDKWYVTSFVADHNHDLVRTSQVPFIRSQREVTEADKIRIKSLIKSGVKPSVALRNVADQAGGLRNLGFTRTDFFNACERFKREEIKDGDTETVLAYLVAKQSSDPGFYMNFTRDKHNAIDKLFWCDSYCRNDYKAFGTVIAFDTTYKVNEYNKPFVVIVGVNHHRKTVPFAVSLITNEKEETYRWVLEQLLEAGGSNSPPCTVLTPDSSAIDLNGENKNAPYTVLTDGDRAMAAAIRAVLPNARHRLCLWHLMRNVKANSDRKFCSGFMKCVDGCRTIDEFEEAWEELVDKYKVKDEQWAKELYKSKEKWGEAFMVGHFFAGMRSTQRCESMNSTLKTVFSKKIMLYRFVELYDQVLNKIRFEEDEDDYNSTHTFPVIDSIFSEIKTHAARIYTRNAYFYFCKELGFESIHLVVKTQKEPNHRDGATNTYWLNDSVKKNAKYIVVHNLVLQQMFCCCLKLDSIGFPCRHMFAVMKYEGMVEIPKGCILRRWTVRAKDHLPYVGNELDKLSSNDETAANGRFAFLSGLGNQLCRMASTSAERSTWLKDKLAKMLLNIEREKLFPDKSEIVDLNDAALKKKKKKKKGKGTGKEKGTGNANGNGKAKGKKKTEEKHDVSAHDITADDVSAHNVGAQNASAQNFSAHNVNVKPGGFVELLRSFMPKTYTAGEVANTTDCYEVRTFEKTPTVFDWNPKDRF